MTCDAKIRPFPDATEVTCERDGERHDEHEGVVRDKAWPGSETRLTWWESDRRTFRGEWRACEPLSYEFGCILPRGHAGRHAL